MSMSIVSDLENQGSLDPKNELDLFCLHYCFLHILKEAIQTFAESWNLHGIATVRNKNPDLLFFLGLESLHKSGESEGILYTELDQVTSQ